METIEWKPITALSRLVLIAGHSPRLVTQNQLYAPEIAHLVTMLAGTGSLSMRLSTYGMAMNLIQTLYMAQFEDKAVAIQLVQILEDLRTPQCLNLFGLDRDHASSEISLRGSASVSISADCLEKITDLLLRTLELGPRSVGVFFSSVRIFASDFLPRPQQRMESEMDESCFFNSLPSVLLWPV